MNQPTNENSKKSSTRGSNPSEASKWDKQKSVLLSRICVVLFAVAYLLLCLAAPFLNRLGRLIPLLIGDRGFCFAATIYVMALPVFTVLWFLHLLLKNISRAEVFTAENVRCLRIISWCCIAAAVIFLVSSLYAVSFVVLAVAAVFLGLVLRIVKNAFAEAVLLKSENDMTI